MNEDQEMVAEFRNRVAKFENFVKCQCRHCGGGVEFDVARNGESALCPHCNRDTVLFIPQSPPFPESITRKIMALVWFTTRKR
jgi:hypothetical protein